MRRGAPYASLPSWRARPPRRRPPVPAPRTRPAPSSEDGRTALLLNFGGFGGGSNPQATSTPTSSHKLAAPPVHVRAADVIRQLQLRGGPLAGDRVQWTDPQTLIFTIRDGVTWSDGTPFTAEDVAFTFKLLKSSRRSTSGHLAYLDTVDGRPTARPSPSTSTGRRLPVHAGRRVDRAQAHLGRQSRTRSTFTNNENPVGTGPFTLKASTPSKWCIERNPNYWQADKVRVQELGFHKAGGARSTSSSWPRRYDSKHVHAGHRGDLRRQGPGAQPLLVPAGRLISLFINLTKAPFDDVEFRRGMPTRSTARTSPTGAVRLLERPARPAPDPRPGGVHPRDPQQGFIPYDPAQAKQILTAAGYTKDGEATCSARTASRSSSPSASRPAGPTGSRPPRSSRRT